MVRKLCLIIGLVICGFLARGLARAETFTLNDGQTLVGEALIDSANEMGLQIKVGDGDYQRVAWGNLSQEKLKELLKQPKVANFVEPFIELPPPDRSKQALAPLKPAKRLEQPPQQSFFGALFGSGLGWFLVLILYAANVYAGYEVAIFRAQPPTLLLGLSAIPVLGFAVPIIFLCRPTQLKSAEAEGEEPSAPPTAAAATTGTPAAAAAAAEAVNPMQAEGVAQPTNLHLAPAVPPAPKAAEAITFQRGQFTFNRRFFETKFPMLFGVVRREEDRNVVMVVKSARGEYVAERISRITADDLYIQLRQGVATEEVMVPFVEIKEVQLKHQDKTAEGAE